MDSHANGHVSRRPRHTRDALMARVSDTSGVGARVYSTATLNEDCMRNGVMVSALESRHEQSRDGDIQTYTHII